MNVQESGGTITYTSERSEPASTRAAWAGAYRAAVPDAIISPKGSLEYFLTERYCLFTVDGDFNAYRVDIHHAPWVLHPAEAEIRTNTMADVNGIRLPEAAPLLHYARRQDVVVWPITRI